MRGSSRTSRMSTDSIVPTTSTASPALLVLLTRHEALMPRMQAVPGGPVVADVLTLDDVLDRRPCGLVVLVLVQRTAGEERCEQDDSEGARDGHSAGRTLSLRLTRT